MALVISFAQATRECRARAEHAPEAIQAAKDVVLDLAVQSVQESWPIDSGVSEEGWDRDETAVLNDVPYVSHVHDGLADRLVPLVLEELIDTFAEVLERELEDAAAGA